MVLLRINFGGGGGGLSGGGGGRDDGAPYLETIVLLVEWA